MTEGLPIDLPMAVAAAVGEFVTGPLLQRPYVVGKPLTKELAAYHSARRGAYRIVYRIDDKAVRRGRGRPPLPQLQLTAPEAVPITLDQHWQAVSLLAPMILDYHHAQRHPAGQAGEQPPTPGWPAVPEPPEAAGQGRS